MDQKVLSFFFWVGFWCNQSGGPLYVVDLLEFDTIMKEWRGKRGGGGTFGVASASSFCEARGFF